jgi:hypothetical protein
MAEATIVSGTIVNDRVDDFTGHRITALLRAVLLGGSDDGGGNEDEAVEVRRAADADAAGSFRLELPPENEWRGPLDLLVTGPSGLVVGSLSGLGTDDDLQNLRVEVTEDVRPVVIEAADDPALGTLPRFTGRVIDPEGRPQRAGLLVVLWGVPPGADDPYPLTVTETIAGGYIAGEWPSDLLVEAHAVVDGGEPVPIMLDGSRVPKRIVLRRRRGLH